MQKKKYLVVYQSRRHLLLTVLLLVLPFAFIFLFAHLINLAAGKLLIDSVASLYRIFIAYVISAALAWFLAVFFHSGKKSSVALPVLDVLQSVPAFALLPLAVSFWGAADFTVIFFLVIAIIWPILFSIVSSLKLVKHDWEEAAEMCGLSGFSYLTHFLLPVSMPGLVTGSIIGLGDGWEALVATEMIVGIKNGFGDFFLFFSKNPSVTVFGVMGFLILIFIINKVVWLPLLSWGHRLMEE